MPISFETWLTVQTPDLVAKGMGLPPLAVTGRALLQNGLNIGASVARMGLDEKSAREQINLAVERYVEGIEDVEIPGLARSVNIDRGVWATAGMRVEETDLRSLLGKFIERLSWNVVGTSIALNPGPDAEAITVISDDFVSTVWAAHPRVDAPYVQIEIGDVIVQPRGSASIEGSFKINGETLPWRFAAPMPTLRATFPVVRAAVALSNDSPEVAMAVYNWASEQAEMLAFATSAELVVAPLAV
ncbi:hypothetical protein GCM10025867_48060 (plasmid) [Frondihabitans sucicola]|uniref:Uncharacterized protein n=2 Tax=Frondihabitans sucicola TaxID=1268041 RepID=A0ABN6Y9C0_9MICO|nr:hypothetical protein GCM10025867_48060 [Frondihabitans sucicola]